jgi:hypothetical protein
VRATLTFDLPEEREDLMDALNGSHYRSALEDIDQRLRSLSKYGGKARVDIDEVRGWIRDEIQETP